MGVGHLVWLRVKCGPSGRSTVGGRAVAKILVADDNSNIQKMVGLALKDQGIDVVAVGNGEAAVRKISDLRPDLVLADVFMPVRNGYEVCQYVKMDASLAHIPVILLVGAFDPLDEQEAQPVQIDSGSQPVAFGSLLETPTDEKDEALGFLPQAHPELVPERDWRDTDVEELDEEAEEEKPPAPWRREEAESYANSGTASGAKDWRSGSFEQILARKAHG